MERAPVTDFNHPPIQLDVQVNGGNPPDLSLGAEAAYPRALQISVTDAEQVFPFAGNAANTLMLFAGVARFGQDSFVIPHEPGPDAGEDNIPEDPDNRFDGSLEVDHGQRLTLQLELHLQQQQFSLLTSQGSAAFAALANAGLDTGNPFGAASDNALIDLTGTSPTRQPLGPKDFWLFSDVIAEEGSQLNRLAYQGITLLQTGTFATPGVNEILVPHVGQIVDLDVAEATQVAVARTLDAGIVDALQIFPGIDDAGNPTSAGANRLLIFSGTALCDFSSQIDNILRRGVVRVRLRFPLPGNLLFKGSATVVALSSIHGNDEQPSTFRSNAARVVTDPTDPANPNPLPQPAGQNLPGGELYLLIDVVARGAENGARPGISSIAYQANVLVQDTEPDLDSISFSLPGQGNFVRSLSLLVNGVDLTLFDMKVALSGPVAANASPFAVVVESDDLQNVGIAQAVVILPQTSFTIVSNLAVLGTAPSETVTVTGTGTRAVRTGTLNIIQDINK